MNNIGKKLINLGENIQKKEKEGTPIDIEWEIINTGLTENPLQEYPECREYIDLEGRNITIRIIIPNKSMGSKLKELKEDKNQLKMNM